MTEAAEIRRRPGGRSARVRRAVLDATAELLVANGLDGLKVSEVAARAEVNETSIYRRWGNRENLLVDALLDASEQLRVPDTGELRADLTTYVTDLAALLATPIGYALEHTFAVGGDEPDMQRARDHYWSSRYERSSRMIVRAVERGELPATVDARLAIEMLVSPVHFRAVLTRDPFDAATAARLVDTLLHGLRAAGAAATAPLRSAGSDTELGAAGAAR